MKKQTKIADFVKSELDFYRQECNFTDEQLKFFNLRASGKSNVEVAFDMNVSERTVSNIAKAVTKKIIKVS